MKKLLFLLTFLSTFAFGQNKGLWKKYIDIPAAPTFSSPPTIVPGDFCCGAGVFAPPHSPPKDYILSGNFSSGFSAREFAGTAGNIYRFRNNAASDIIGPPNGTTNGVSTTNFGNYLYFYGKSYNEPMVIKGDIGCQFPSASGGFNGLIQNTVMKTPDNSGITANYPIVSTNYYNRVEAYFNRIFNSDQEAFYFGDTGGSYNGTNYLNIVITSNNFGYNIAREFMQGEHINVWTCTHNTVRLAGQAGTTFHTNLLQAHDLGPGSKIEYNIFDSAPDAGNVFTHGTSISHNYFGFSVAGIYQGRTDNSYFSTSTRLTGDSVIYDGNDFNYTGGGTLAYVIDINERVAPIIIRNNTFSTNITAAYIDHRAPGYTNTITGGIGDHGNTSSAITAPAYPAGYNDPDNPIVHGLINTTSPHYAKHRGFRVP